MTEGLGLTWIKSALLVAVLATGVCGWLLAARSEPWATGAAGSRGSLAPPFELPVRRAQTEMRPTAPAALPAALLAPPELTAELEQHHGGQRTRKVVTRGADRVHIQLGSTGTGPEWLFRRNPLDPSRVSAARIDHAHRAILEYDESTLRSQGIAQGWAEVVTLGVSPEVLRTFHASGQQEQHLGLPFEAHGPAAGQGLALGAAVQELWWNGSMAVPWRLRVTGPAGEVTTELVALREGVERDLLADPRHRFPAYAVVDAIDWLEKNHDHGATAESGAHHP